MSEEEKLERVITVSKIAEAHDFITHFPEKYYTILDNNASNLSGGQKQRICIARALINKPKILIFDEATSMLDVETELAIRETLQKILQRERFTSIQIVHNLRSIQYVDNIVVFQNGRVGEQGSHNQLCDIPGSRYNAMR